MRITYDERIFNNTGEDLGDAWGAVGAIGAATVQLLPGLFGGGGSSAGGPARGLAAITAAVNQALSSLNQLLVRARSGQAVTALAEAERIANALSDPQYVYQAQRGNDAAKLNEGKQQAAAIVAQIRALATQTPVTVPNGSTGGVANNPVTGGGANNGGNTAAAPIGNSAGGGAFGGFDNSTVLLVGGGLALLLLLK